MPVVHLAVGPERHPADRLTGLNGFAAAVLVGGASSRMGTDKALVEVDGVTLARRAVDLLRSAGAREVVTVGGSDRGAGVEHVDDRYPGEGPLGGLITALATFGVPPAVDTAVVVIACDLPLLSPGTVSHLLAALEDNDAAIARTDRLEPLCAVWRPERVLPRLERSFASGERAIRRSLTGLRTVEVVVGEAELVNLNTPDELEVLRRERLGGAGGRPAN